MLRKAFFGLLGLAVVAALFALAWHHGLLSWSYWLDVGKTGDSRSEVVRNLGLLAAGILALIVGASRAYAANEQAKAANEQARIAQQGHFTDRFSTAVEQLGSKQLPVRLGGIYALWRLLQDSPERDMTSVIDILCAFVRDPPHVTPTDPPIRPDVQAVLNLIGNRNV